MIIDIIYKQINEILINTHYDKISDSYVNSISNNTARILSALIETGVDLKVILNLIYKFSLTI